MKPPEVPKKYPSLKQLAEGIKQKDLATTLQLLQAVSDFLMEGIGTQKPYDYLKEKDCQKALNALFQRILIHQGVIPKSVSEQLTLPLLDGGMTRLVIYVEDGKVEVELGGSAPARSKEKWTELLNHQD